MRRVIHMPPRYAGSTAFVVALLVGLPACGTLSDQRAEGAHSVLDTVTDVVDPLYEAAVLGCDATEGVIVARNSTREEDDRDLAQVREVCDQIFAAFEGVRQAQLMARTAIEAARADAESPAVQEAAVLAVGDLHQAASAARAVWERERPTLEAVIRVQHVPDRPPDEPDRPPDHSDDEGGGDA